MFELHMLAEQLFSYTKVLLNVVSITSDAFAPALKSSLEFSKKKKNQMWIVTHSFHSPVSPRLESLSPKTLLHWAKTGKPEVARSGCTAERIINQPNLANSWFLTKMCVVVHWYRKCGSLSDTCFGLFCNGFFKLLLVSQYTARCSLRPIQGTSNLVSHSGIM